MVIRFGLSVVLLSSAAFANAPGADVLRKLNSAPGLPLAARLSVSPNDQGADAPWTDVGLAANPLFPNCATPLSELKQDAVDPWFQQALDSESNSLIVVRDGCTVVERHFGLAADEVFSVQSVTKSVASLAIGSLLDSGKLKNLDVPLSQFFPSLASDPDKSLITIRHLLSQTSGYGDWDTMSSVGSTSIEKALNSKLLSKPGAEWHYSSMAVFLLGAIIHSISGIPADQYMAQHLFNPIGVTSAAWPGHTSEVVDTGGGLFLNSRDMLRIGKLMLDQGQWNSQAVLSKSWVQSSVSPSQDLFTGYGLLWWLYASSPPAAAPVTSYDEFSAVGFQGQYITVWPAKNLIVVRTHQVENTTDLPTIDKVTWEGFPSGVVGLVP